ncbi:hypothetical protein CPB85DRAFT_1252580 [Mucidula mucida]|nr:hypothetical protein CPB85DRAFT_1252580 [Mucidula mucida]
MLEDNDKASTCLTLRKRTTCTKEETDLAGSMLQGFIPSAMDVFDDDMDCNNSKDYLHWSGSEEETDKEMEVSGWRVLSPSKGNGLYRDLLLLQFLFYRQTARLP